MDDAPILTQDLIIGACPATMIELIWDKVMPLLQLVIDKSDDIDASITKERLQAGENMLVTISRGSEIIAINVLDARFTDTGIKYLSIPITAGSEMENWLEDFLKIAEAIAKDYGCGEIRGFAVRNGWLRKLKPYGWDELFTTIRYKIGD